MAASHARAEVFRQLDRIAGRMVVLQPVGREIAAESLAACVESAAELHRWMPWENRTIDDVITFVDRAIAACNDGSQLQMTIHERSSGRLLGHIGAQSFDPFTPRCELGYWIRTSAAGRGHATDAVAACLGFLRDAARIVRVNAYAAVTNLASQRVLVKCGFREEGLLERGELCHGVWHDLKLFGALLD